MPKKKRNRNNTPKRLSFNRKQRLESAKQWLLTYDGQHVARSYRKRYAVDVPTSFVELEMLGVAIDPNHKRHALAAFQRKVEAQQKKRLQKRHAEEEILAEYQDENFAHIVGYTSGGFPYGLTWDEWDMLGLSEEEDEDEEEEKKS